MSGRTASLLSRGSPPPALDSAGSASAPASTGPARAALLQAPRISLKRDGAAAGLPERAGRNNRAALVEPDPSPSRFANTLPKTTLKF